MNIKKTIALGISSLILLSVSLPALSGAAVTVPSTTKNTRHHMTWQQFLNKYPDATVEYKYSADKKMLAANPSQVSLQKVKLPAGTPVVLRLTESVKSDDATTGTTIHFTVSQDVSVDGKVLIQAGASGSAQVSASDTAGMIGQPGKITITDFSVKAVDGSVVFLRGTISGKGSDKIVTSAALSLLICPLFVLMKGGQASVPAGTEKTTYTAADAEIGVK